MSGERGSTKMTEADLLCRLRQRYWKPRTPGNGPSAVVLPQVRNRAGFEATRTADALVMQLWPSNGLHLEGFEIKCSRTDWLKELAQPEKSDEFARWCDRWWLLTADPSIVKEGELPDGWGHMTVRGEGLRIVTQAPVRPVPDHFPKSMLASMLRQFDREAARPAPSREETQEP